MHLECTNNATLRKCHPQLQFGMTYGTGGRTGSCDITSVQMTCDYLLRHAVIHAKCIRLDTQPKLCLLLMLVYAFHPDVQTQTSQCSGFVLQSCLI